MSHVLRLILHEGIRIDHFARSRCLPRLLRPQSTFLPRYTSGMAENKPPQGILDKVKNLALGDATEGKEDVQKDAKQKKDKKKDKSSNELVPRPEFIDHRIKIFDEHWAKYQAEIASKPREDITITLPDGKTQIAKSFETTPQQIAELISKSLAKEIVIAKVDGELWDLERPLEKSCNLQFLKFEDEEGRAVYWHSSAHVLGEAAERRYGCLLSHGPPTSDGFFYDMAMENAVSLEDYKPLEKIAESAIQEKQPFQRLDLDKDTLLDMFKYSKYKVHFIKDKIPDGGSTTVYRCGPLIDLCTGPHIPHTGRIKAFSVMKNSAAYWLGDAKNDSLQRIYGVSFPDKKQMTEYKELLAEAAKRDHRKIGREQDLYFFHELSPGSAFWLPHGMRIYNTLQNFIRSEYHARGFQEVGTPNMYNSELWVKSGHWQNYKDDMFTLRVDDKDFALKPMNCPGHCLMFQSTSRTYREFPIRYADFGVLHRNEASGALTGLTRVRRFQQDDAHIFCRQDQLKDEIMGCFDFLSKIYETFGFQFKLVLSTRNPAKFLGSIETWNNAEAALASALDERVGPGKWKLNPEDGAFYGPKIDITISDALKRDHQCATIQLDYQLPDRFDLKYQTRDSETQNYSWNGEPLSKTGVARPIMIHRAILGSVERMTAILTEHFGGKWPLWLSPRQVIVIPVAHPFDGYAQEVADRLHNEGFFVEANLSSETLPKKVLEAQVSQWNYILVVGKVEEDGRSVNVRIRDDVSTRHQGVPMALDEFVSKLVKLRDDRSLKHSLEKEEVGVAVPNGA